jgi:hypothetical protein
MQLSDRQDLPWFGRNPNRKIALRQGKNTPVASVRVAVSLGQKLDFSQV